MTKREAKRRAYRIAADLLLAHTRDDAPDETEEEYELMNRAMTELADSLYYRVKDPSNEVTTTDSP